VTDPATFQARSEPGTVVDSRYELRAAIGTGGMGTVWRATDTQLGREVAVKEVVPPSGVTGEERDAMYERMLREARAAASVSHPSVVQVYDVVTDGGRPWVVMELLDARSLAEIILADGPLGPRAVAKIGVALLGALETAHAAGVLHRDVKPANVLICADGRCVLTDFGVARLPTDAELTTPGMVLGSPYFISPERALGAAFGPPSDLFSLGVTLYTAVEGRPPFDRGDPISTMHAVVEEEPVPPDRAGPLAPVLYGLMDKDPDRRLDAATARAQLRELLAGPLASRSAGYVTDPQAVLPPQWGPAPAVTAGPSVGGRAMLPPGQDPYQPGAGGHADPYQQLPDAYREVPDPYGAPGPRGRHHAVGPTRGRRPGAGPARAVQPLRAVAGRAITMAGRIPRRWAAVAAALTAVALVALIVAVNAGDGDTEPPPAATGPPTSPGSSPPAADLIPVQRFEERGIVVNLPEGWHETGSTQIRVDFADPDDASARIRLLREPSGADAMRFIEVVEPNIESSCDDPYQRVGLSEIEVAGEPAALLEYTCGSGDGARHSLWATVVRDEVAHSFFLSVRENQFEDRKVIFEEMVRSFRFAE
jgi:hypothetical protein